MKKWNIQNYHDIDAPCLFAGAYTKEDIEIINAHRGFKVLWFCGVDVKNYNKIDPRNLVVRVGTAGGDELFREVGLKFKYAPIELKDYSMFKPNVLGDKVYCYVRYPKKYEFFRKGLADEVQKHIDYEILFGEWKGEVKIESIHELKEKYYDKCFVNLRLNPACGGTTSVELAHMGRYSICNREVSYCKNYDGVEDIVRLIEIESKKIGTIQQSLIGNFYSDGDKWKQVDFWKC